MLNWLLTDFFYVMSCLTIHVRTSFTFLSATRILSCLFPVVPPHSSEDSPLLSFSHIPSLSRKVITITKSGVTRYHSFLLAQDVQWTRMIFFSVLFVCLFVFLGYHSIDGVVPGVRRRSVRQSPRTDLTELSFNGHIHWRLRRSWCNTPIPLFLVQI